jgi:hypothetical protein
VGDVAGDEGRVLVLSGNVLEDTLVDSREQFEVILHRKWLVVKHLSFVPIHLLLHMINRILKECLDPRDLANIGKPLGQDFLKVFSLIELI